MSASLSEIIYQQAKHAVSLQASQLDELRMRTTLIFAASGVVSGLVGRTAIQRGLGAFGYLALLAFALSSLLCVAVLYPQWEAWTFSINARKLKTRGITETDAMYDRLSDQIQGHYDKNKKKLNRLYIYFALACICLAVEFVLWFLALI